MISVAAFTVILKSTNNQLENYLSRLMIQEKTVGSASYPSKRIVQVENIRESELYERII